MVHFFTLLCNTATWNDQILHCVENMNHDNWFLMYFFLNLSLCPTFSFMIVLTVTIKVTIKVKDFFNRVVPSVAFVLTQTPYCRLYCSFSKSENCRKSCHNSSFVPPWRPVTNWCFVWCNDSWFQMVVVPMLFWMHLTGSTHWFLMTLVWRSRQC